MANVTETANITEIVNAFDRNIDARNARILNGEVKALPALTEKERAQAIARIDKGVVKIKDAYIKAQNGYLSIINDLARLRSSFPSGKITVDGKKYSSFRAFAMDQWSFSKSMYHYLCNIIDRFYDVVEGKVPDEIIGLGFNQILAYISEEKKALEDKSSTETTSDVPSNDAQPDANSTDNTEGSTLDEMYSEFKEHIASTYVFDDFKSFEDEVKLLKAKNRLQFLNGVKIIVSYEYAPDTEVEEG